VRPWSRCGTTASPRRAGHGHRHVCRRRQVAAGTRPERRSLRSGWIARHIVRDMPAPYVAAFAQSTTRRFWWRTSPIRKLEAVRAARDHGRALVRRLRLLRQRAAADGGRRCAGSARPRETRDADILRRLPQSGMPIGPQTMAARGRMFATSYAEYERQIAGNFRRCSAMRASTRARHRRHRAQPLGPRVHRTAARLFISARLPPRRRSSRPPALRADLFGHSELSGRQSWGRAAQEGRQCPRASTRSLERMTRHDRLMKMLRVSMNVNDCRRCHRNDLHAPCTAGLCARRSVGRTPTRRIRDLPTQTLRGRLADEESRHSSALHGGRRFRDPSGRLRGTAALRSFIYAHLCDVRTPT